MIGNVNEKKRKKPNDSHTKTIHHWHPREREREASLFFLFVNNHVETETFSLAGVFLWLGIMAARCVEAEIWHRCFYRRHTHGERKRFVGSFSFLLTVRMPLASKHVGGSLKSPSWQSKWHRHVYITWTGSGAHDGLLYSRFSAIGQRCARVNDWRILRHRWHFSLSLQSSILVLCLSVSPSLSWLCLFSIEQIDSHFDCQPQAMPIEI